MGTPLSNDLRDQIRKHAGSILESHLKPWLERKFSIPKIVTEISIPVFMQFRSMLSLDTEPIRRDGRTTKILLVQDMKEVQKAIFKELDTKLCQHAREGYEAPQRRLAFREPPVLEGAFAPEVARRSDLKVSPLQKQALQLLTDKEWVVNQFNWEAIKAYRDVLSEDDRDKVFYDHQEDVLSGLVHMEEGASGDKIRDLLDRIDGCTFFLPVRRVDESGRMYADPLHPMYSRFIRACIQSPPEKLTEEGWQFFRSYLDQSYGLKTDEERDAWAERWRKNHLEYLKAGGKKAADELAASTGWREARETGATGYEVLLDFVAQGMGLLAAVEGCKWHHSLVNTKHPKFISAHDRFSLGLKEEERNFIVHSNSALKPISKGVITPVMYSGGAMAVAAMLTGMKKDLHGEWWWGEDGEKIPEIHPILQKMIGEGLNPSQQMRAMERLGKQFTRICRHQFPFLKRNQDAIRREWETALKAGTAPVYKGPDGYELVASPFTTNKDVTVAIRCSRYDEHGDRVQPRTSVFPHVIDESGTSMSAKRNFMLDRLIACYIVIDMWETCRKHVSSIHDAFRTHPNYGYRLERSATRAYNRACHQQCEVLGRSYNPLPDDALLIVP